MQVNLFYLGKQINVSVGNQHVGNLLVKINDLFPVKLLYCLIVQPAIVKKYILLMHNYGATFYCQVFHSLSKPKVIKVGGIIKFLN